MSRIPHQQRILAGLVISEIPDITKRIRSAGRGVVKVAQREGDAESLEWAARVSRQLDTFGTAASGLLKLIIETEGVAP